MNTVLIARNAVDRVPPSDVPVQPPSEGGGAGLSFLEALAAAADSSAEGEFGQAALTNLTEEFPSEDSLSDEELEEVLYPDQTEPPGPEGAEEQRLDLAYAQAEPPLPTGAEEALVSGSGPASDLALATPDEESSEPTLHPLLVDDPEATTAAERVPEEALVAERRENEGSVNPRASANAQQPATDGVNAKAPERPEGSGESPHHESDAKQADQEEGRPSAFSRAAPRAAVLDPAAQPTPASPSSAGRETARVAVRTLPELPVQNESRILAQVRVLVEDQGGTARIRLEPPQLGELNLRVTVRHDLVQLNLMVDRSAIADVFNRHLPELRGALEAQGLQIDHAQVDVRDREDSDDSRSPASLFDDNGDPNRSGDRGPHGDWPAPEHTRGGSELVINDLGAVNVHV
jgi:flagellar hook-length control protein FliK